MTSASDGKPLVLLLHGLMRTKSSMAQLQKRIARAGYPTCSLTYASRRLPIEEAASYIVETARREAAGREIVAVTHSLGGIVARHVAVELPLKGAVMIAPPNDGSRLARAFGRYAPFHWFYGPAGRQLADATKWPLPSCPVAVIAGTKRVGPSPISWIATAPALLGREDSDGTVLVRETHLPGMVDFATVPASHTFIMNHPATAEMVLRFLSTGKLQ